MHNVFSSDKLYFVCFIFSCSFGLNIIMFVCGSSSMILLPLGDSGSHSGSNSADAAVVTFIFLRVFIVDAPAPAASALRNDKDVVDDG